LKQADKIPLRMISKLLVCSPECPCKEKKIEPENPRDNAILQSILFDNIKLSRKMDELKRDLSFKESQLKQRIQDDKTKFLK